LSSRRVTGNYPILGTSYHTQDIVVMPLAKGNAFAGALPNPYHDKIDYTKPGAQEYISSIVALFASWGFDYIKLDGVTPGSYVDNLSIDNRPDVQAWSQGIAQSGRPMWLTASWDLDEDYLSTWQQFANARRIDQDVECEGRCAGLTDWPRIVLREYEDVNWENAASPTLGWNRPGYAGCRHGNRRRSERYREADRHHNLVHGELTGCILEAISPSSTASPSPRSRTTSFWPSTSPGIPAYK